MHVEITEILINVPNHDYMSYCYKLYNTCPYHLIIISNKVHIYILLNINTLFVLYK